MIYNYGRKDGLKGLESEYEFKDEILYIRIQGSNSWQDFFWDFLAWPRKKYNGKKYHRFWFKQSEKFATFLKSKRQLKKVKKIQIVGHSMGGANAAILPIFMTNKKFEIKLINSPKIGNKKAVDWLKENTETVAFYDKGDIVRYFPLLYKKFSDNRSYEKTKPFWKAHSNFPVFWKKFFEREK
jgi:hypothetical protein